MWDLPIDTVTFSYNRPGNLYGIIIDSIYFMVQSNQCNESFDLGNNLKLCEGENTVVSPLSFIQGDYLWNTLDTTKSISVSKQGWYHLTVTNQQCIYKDSIYITVNPLEIKTQTINLTKCLNESITLTSPVIGTNYHWSNSETKSYINISDFNTYVVIVNNYCKIDSIIFNVNDQKCICNFKIQDHKICKNEKITVGFENDPTKFYLWNTNEKSSKISIEKSGVYWLNISDGKCSYRDTFKVELMKEDVKFHALTLDKCLDEKIEITPTFFGDSCIWYNGKKDWTISVDDSGIYHLNVFSKCQIDSIVYKVKNKPCECMLFIPNTFTPNADEFNNSFKAVLECDYSNFHMLIFNRWGEIIFESFNVNYGWDGTYDDKIVQDGVYIYKVEYTNHATKQNFEHVGHLNLLK
jgi:gliding motility-associated-like protein